MRWERLNERQQEHAQCAELQLSDEAEDAIPQSGHAELRSIRKRFQAPPRGIDVRVGDTTAIEPPSIVAMCQKQTRRPTRPTALARDDASLSLSR
jgi:hypothetical protein